MRPTRRMGIGLRSGILSVVCVLGLGTLAAAEGKKLALLVGCEKYRHGELPVLEYAEEDVLELAEVLKPQGFTCVVLTHVAARNDPQREPTAANIRTALKNLLREVDRHDLLLVALAGHGMQPVGCDQPFFLPVDANPTAKPARDDTTVEQAFTRPETVIGIGTMLAEIQESGVGQKLLILDACRNAPLFRGRNAGGFSFQTVPAQTAILLSCSSGQLANESAALAHGLFFQAVLEGLRGEAADRKGVVTLDQLAAYAKGRTREFAEELKTRQQPQSLLNLDGEPIVLARVAAAPKVPAPVPIPAAPNSPSAAGPTPSLLTWPFDIEQARAGQREWVKSYGWLIRRENSAEMTMVFVPPGRFTMGSPEGEAGRNANEAQVPVTLTKPFLMSATEVSVRTFREFVKQRSYQTDAERDGRGGFVLDSTTGRFVEKGGVTWKDPGFYQHDDSPVVLVSWNDAQQFCDWLKDLHSAPYRLPTEAEWEWACRAGTRTAFWCGDDPEGLAAAGNVADASAKSQFPAWSAIRADDQRPLAAEVGRFKRNPFGLHDQHGNVWEWCADAYREKLPGGENPRVKPGVDDTQRVIRGGCFSDDGASARSANRLAYSAATRASNVGFRVVMGP